VQAGPDLGLNCYWVAYTKHRDLILSDDENRSHNRYIVIRLMDLDPERVKSAGCGKVPDPEHMLLIEERNVKQFTITLAGI
jgi:hypothetical protein